MIKIWNSKNAKNVNRSKLRSGAGGLEQEKLADFTCGAQRDSNIVGGEQGERRISKPDYQQSWG